VLFDFTYGVPEQAAWANEPWARHLHLALNIDKHYARKVFVEPAVQGPQVLNDEIVLLRYVLKMVLLHKRTEDGEQVITLEAWVHVVPSEVECHLGWTHQSLDSEHARPSPPGIPGRLVTPTNRQTIYRDVFQRPVSQADAAGWFSRARMYTDDHHQPEPAP
jgi:hypothetical protein